MGHTLPESASCTVFYPPDGVEAGRFPLREPGPREVLVETVLSCVSPGTEGRTLAGEQVADSGRRGIVPGYAAMGRVAACGTDASWGLGDRVVLSSGGEDTGPYVRAWGAHASHAVVSAASLFAVPEGVSDANAVFARLAAIPHHGFRLAAAAPGEKVAVVGLGAIGLPAAKLFHATGCETMAIDRASSRRAMASAWGLDAVEPARSTAATIRGRFPDGADVIFDATGVAAVVADAADGLRTPPWHEPIDRPSRYVVQGSYAGDVAAPYRALFEREAHVLFPRDWEPGDLKTLLTQLAAGRLDFAPLLPEPVDPADAASAYRSLADPGHDALTALFRWAET